MKISALKTTHIIQLNEDLFGVLKQTLEHNNRSLQENSIVVIAETLVGTTQGRIVDLGDVQEISQKANTLAKKYQMDPRFAEIVVNEADQIFGGIPGMLLTEKEGVLIANSGIDKSNAGYGEKYSLWPSNPYQAAEDLTIKVKNHYNLENFGIIISDSRVQPMKRGVVGVAIGVAGFFPTVDERGKQDLYGHKMEFTVRALADQISDAAHIVMGECNEQTPFVLVENAPVNFTIERINPKDMIMPMEEDLFVQILKNFNDQKEI